MNTRFSQTLLIAVFSACTANIEQQDTKAAFAYFDDELRFTASPVDIKMASEGSIVIVDLRKKEDFDAGHIPGAINIPFDKYGALEGKQTTFPGLSKDKINCVYCYTLLCNLSQKAAKKFASLGYPVKEVKGGFEEWCKLHYPIEKAGKDLK